MNRLSLSLLLFFLSMLPTHRANAQVQQLEQLALDIEKLAQMKSILSEMYKGYEILTGGYNTIKSIAEGNFNLHSAYLNGLLSVSPAVKNYVRVADIISSEATLVSEYKAALKGFSGSGLFSPTELNYFSTVFSNLFNQSINNMDELVMILTNSELRASDAERLNAIDHIYNDMQDKLSFLRMFNGQAGILARQRQHDLQSNNILKSLYGN
jgi:hypothetical protein